jgi:hypothetical protein
LTVLRSAFLEHQLLDRQIHHGFAKTPVFLPQQVQAFHLIQNQTPYSVRHR